MEQMQDEPSISDSQLFELIQNSSPIRAMNRQDSNAASPLLKQLPPIKQQFFYNIGGGRQ